MKPTLAIIAIVAVTVGPFVYDGSGKRNCRFTYDRSFNGLYLLKQEQCAGRLGIPRQPRTVDRKPLFEEF